MFFMLLYNISNNFVVNVVVNVVVIDGAKLWIVKNYESSLSNGNHIRYPMD